MDILSFHVGAKFLMDLKAGYTQSSAPSWTLPKYRLRSDITQIKELITHPSLEQAHEILLEPKPDRAAAAMLFQAGEKRLLDLLEMISGERE